MKKRIANISDQKVTAIKKTLRRFLPAWYLPKGTMKAVEESRLEEASSSCELWAIICGALVVSAVIAEFVIAHFQPPYEIFLIESSYADAAIAIGIVGEVLLGMWNNNIQTELRRRSNERLARIKESAVWRTLTNEERGPLTLALRASGPPQSVRFTVLANDPESLYFAGQISISFKAAGWKVGYAFESYSHGIMTGVLLPEARDNWLDGMRLVNQRVRDAFIAANLDFATGWPMEPYMQSGAGEALTAPFAWVYIGPKHMPML